MRILLGVDGAGCWKSASVLLGNLRFHDGVVDTLHFVESPLYPWADIVDAIIPQMMEEDNAKAYNEGERMSKEATAALGQGGVLTGVSQAEYGSPAQGLMDYADGANVALIAVGSSGKSPARSFFTGSVGRGLLIEANQSVLIARSETAPNEPVRVVFATDHSAYATRCVDMLLALAPQGISHLTVLTAYPKAEIETVRPFLTNLATDPAQAIKAGLEQRNQAVIQKLAPLGCPFMSLVLDGEVHETIKYAMKASHSDLLILGAQGHGFVERITLGSVSFQEAMGEAHSVLVLRLQPNAFTRAGK